MSLTRPYNFVRSPLLPPRVVTGVCRRRRYRRERPKPLLGSDGALLGLWNGAWPCHKGGDEDDSRDAALGCQSYTVFTPIAS